MSVFMFYITLSETFLILRIIHLYIIRKDKGKLGRLRRRWEDNIKMDLQEVGRGCGD